MCLARQALYQCLIIKVYNVAINRYEMHDHCFCSSKIRAAISQQRHLAAYFQACTSHYILIIIDERSRNIRLYIPYDLYAYIVNSRQLKL